MAKNPVRRLFSALGRLLSKPFSRRKPPKRQVADYTPLWQAMAAGDLDQTRQLLAEMANPPEGGALLQKAVSSGSLEITKWLLEQGIDPNPSLKRLLVSQVVQRNNLALLELLHRYGADLNTNPAPLCMALAYNNEPMARWLLEHQADPNGLDEQQNTALRLAIRNNNVELGRLLLTYGADPNNDPKDHPLYVTLVNKTGDSPEKQAFIELLLPYVNNRIKPEQAYTLFQALVHQNRFDLLQTLVRQGLPVPTRLDQPQAEGRTLVHQAVSHRNEALVTFLLDLGFPAEGGMTNATFQNEPQDSRISRRQSGHGTSLYLALSYKLEALALRLLAHGADPNDPYRSSWSRRFELPGSRDYWEIKEEVQISPLYSAIDHNLAAAALAILARGGHPQLGYRREASFKSSGATVAEIDPTFEPGQQAESPLELACSQQVPLLKAVLSHPTPQQAAQAAIDQLFGPAGVQAGPLPPHKVEQVLRYLAEGI